MSFIQVPLGQGISKFPKLRFSQPEFEKTKLTKPIITDIELLIELAELGQLVIEEGSITTVGDMVTITPDTGTTFFFLGATVQNTDATLDGTAEIQNNGTVQEAVKLAPDEFYEFKLPLDRLVGNMNKTYILTGITPNTSMQGTLYGWTENTQRP